MTADDIIARLFGVGVNSHDRVLHLLKHTKDVETPTFWRVFQCAWPSCDNTWEARDHLLSRLLEHRSSAPYLEGEDREFFESLPTQLTIYRGASRKRARGISWTIDRTVAEQFAEGHRGITVPDPVVATASFPKDAIFTVSSARTESEVLVWPALLPRLKYERRGRPTPSNCV